MPAASHAAQHLSSLVPACRWAAAPWSLSCTGACKNASQAFELPALGKSSKELCASHNKPASRRSSCDFSSLKLFVVEDNFGPPPPFVRQRSIEAPASSTACMGGTYRCALNSHRGFISHASQAAVRCPLAGHTPSWSGFRSLLFCSAWVSRAMQSRSFNGLATARRSPWWLRPPEE